MKAFFNKTKRALQKSWSILKRPFEVVFSKVQVVYVTMQKLLRYMSGEVKKHLPDWREDVVVYKKERRDQWKRLKENFEKKWLDWKQTFSNVDASPEKLHEMLFEDKTMLGKRFEEILIVLIFASILVVALDSVSEIHRRLGWLLDALEWFFTISFTIEYLLRIYSSPHPIRYITSFFGIIDLITILPTYIALVFTQAHTFLVLRILRVFRVFRLLKLVKMMRASTTIVSALNASKAKIAVFLFFVLLLVTLMGSVLYIIEAEQDSGFTSIPNSIYWAIVTLTTVGYGDIAPATWIGKLIAACIMITGYSVIAVPTGIVSAEFAKENKKSKKTISECLRCGKEKHEQKARYCSRCGEKLEAVKEIN